MPNRKETEFVFEQVNLAVARYSARVAVASDALVELLGNPEPDARVDK